MAKLTTDLVAEKLREHDGNIAAVGRAFGVTRQAVQSFLRTRPSLQEILQEARETMKDDVESALYKEARRGEGWAVCFFLKTQGKDRGYVERTETEISGTLRTEAVETLVRTREDAAKALADLPETS